MQYIRQIGKVSHRIVLAWNWSVRLTKPNRIHPNRLKSSVLPHFRTKAAGRHRIAFACLPGGRTLWHIVLRCAVLCSALLPRYFAKWRLAALHGAQAKNASTGMALDADSLARCARAAVRVIARTAAAAAECAHRQTDGPRSACARTRSYAAGDFSGGALSAPRVGKACL